MYIYIQPWAGALGEDPSGNQVHGVPKTIQEKSANPDGKGSPSGSQKGSKKEGKTRPGCTVGAEEKMGEKRDTKEQPHILKPRLWCERCVETQVMCVSEILQKRNAKGGVK